MTLPMRLKPAQYPSPLELSTQHGDAIANFVSDDDYVPLHIVQRAHKASSQVRFALSGPRQQVAYRSHEVRAAIITCGGLCPGLNDVIRGVVTCLHERYQAEEIKGFQYGYYGLSEAASGDHPPLSLTPTDVQNIHRVGGSFLGSSRGSVDLNEQVNTLLAHQINQLYCVGGDGTMRGAQALAKALRSRGVSLSVIGIPKTIDNDLPFVERTFGFDTAVSMAVEAIRSARAEASSALRGVGLVKLMGRHAGFIAASAARASREVDLVLVPELPFRMGQLFSDCTRGVLPYVERRLQQRGQAVIVIAEGVGQGQTNQPPFATERGFDASGNSKLGDAGVAFKSTLNRSFGESGAPINLKYIDPSYMIRATAPSSRDAIYCAQLAEDAVHAAMSGFSEVLIGQWGGVGTLVPFSLLAGGSKRLDLDGAMWRHALDATGQPSDLT